MRRVLRPYQAFRRSLDFPEISLSVTKERGLARAGPVVKQYQRRAGLGRATKPEALGCASDVRKLHRRHPAGNQMPVCILEGERVNATREQE
jgi:hypothetical protein